MSSCPLAMKQLVTLLKNKIEKKLQCNDNLSPKFW